MGLIPMEFLMLISKAGVPEMPLLGWDVSLLVFFSRLVKLTLLSFLCAFTVRFPIPLRSSSLNQRVPCLVLLTGSWDLLMLTLCILPSICKLIYRYVSIKERYILGAY